MALRAGAVVLALAFVVSHLVDRHPRAELTATATAASQSPTARPKAPPPPPVPPQPPPSRLVSIAATGDIVMGSTPNLPADEGRGFFAGVQTDLAGDVVLGNLEGTLSIGGTSKCGPTSTDCYAFQTPPSYAKWLKRAGFTVMNLANNHAYDYGPSGQRQTVAALDRLGILHTGRPNEVALVRVNGVKVAVLGFAPYPWASSLTDIPKAVKMVKQAARQADLVIVTMHAGAEGTDHQHVLRGTETYLGENRGNERAFAHAVVDAGADLVVGHGPHVLRGMEWRKGRLIAYSLGNFGGYKVFSLGGPLSTSGILRVTLRSDGKYESGVLVATRLDARGVPQLDPTEAAHAVVRQLSKQDFGARAVRVSSSGELLPAAR